MSFVLLPLALALLSTVHAQLVGGQYFTRGLAISNAPAPNSEFTVGGTIGVSVDVSGNGRLPQGSWGPNSTLPSGFISLSLYLVSNDHNVTIIDGTDGAFLAGEPGSTVKHLSYVIPNCLPAGNYDYTYYEVSRMNDTMYFGITPIPIRILNPSGPSGECNSTISNPVQTRPQNDSVPAQNPFTGGLALNTTSGSSPSTTFMPSRPISGQSTAETIGPAPTPNGGGSTSGGNGNSNTSDHTGNVLGVYYDAQAAYRAQLIFPIRHLDATANFSSTSRAGLRHSMSALALLGPGFLTAFLAW